EGHKTSSAAVLINHNRELIPAGTKLREENIKVRGLGHAQWLGSDCPHRHLRAPLARNGDGGLEVSNTDDVVEILVVHRESAVPGFTSQLQNFIDAVADRNRVHTRSGCHHIPSCVSGKTQGSVKQGGGV